MTQWRAFWAVCRFELALRLRAPSTWVLFGLLALKTFVDFLSAEWDALIGSGSVARNSPYAAYLIFIYCAFWSATLGAGLMTAPLLRDLRTRAGQLVYATPVSDRSYLLGKYVAALIMFLLVLAGIYAGYALVHPLARALSLVPPEEVIPTPWAQSLHAFALGTGFAVVVWGTLHFCLAAWTGKPSASYVLAASLLMVFIVIEAVFHESPETRAITQIVDPLGKAAFDSQSAYWSAAQRNTSFVAVSGTLLLNRLLYLAIAGALLAVTLWRFELRTFLARSRRRSRVVDDSALDVSQRTTLTPRLSHAELVAARGQFGIVGALQSGWQQFILVTRELPVRAAFAMVVLLSASAAGDMGGYYTPPSGRLLPIAIVALPNIVTTLYFPALLLVLFFAADIVSRDRTARIAPLVDATPAPLGLRVVAHLTAVGCFALTVAALPVLALLIVQLPAGIIDPDPLAIARATMLTLAPGFAIYAALPVLWYALTASRSAAQGLGIISALTPIILHEIGAVDRHLLLFGVPFEVGYSGFDISGAAIARQVLAWLYFAGIAAVLLTVAYALWPLGVEVGWRGRFMQLRGRVSRTPAAVAIAGAFLAIVTGAWLYQQIEVAGAYEPADVSEANNAAYEETYRSARSVPQPKTVAARIAIDLTGGSGITAIRGELRVRNLTAEPIELLHIDLPTHEALRGLRWNGHAMASTHRDAVLRHEVYRVSPPLPPTAEAMLSFEADLAYEGFSNEGHHGTLTAGANVVTQAMLPSFGYNRSRELRMPGIRRRYGLPARAPLPSATTSASVRDRAGSDDADALDVEFIVRVPTPHTAVAPGTLVDVLDEGTSRVFRFRTDRPISWNLAIASAPYRRVNDVWTAQSSPHRTNIEVFFNEKHAWNVPRIVDAVKVSLDTYSTWYGPYPYSTVRIAEVPEGFSSTTSSANLILIPERDGWLHDYRAGASIDWIQFVVARELAKTWWGELVPAADAKGASLLTKSVPAYEALDVLDARRGREQVAHYLRVASDEYLRQRVSDGVDEVSVVELDDEQYSTHKGMLALTAARRLLGPERVRQTLSQFWAAHARQEPPFADASGLVEALASSADHRSRRHVRSLFTDATPRDVATLPRDLP
jgi:hypothetical protein